MTQPTPDPTPTPTPQPPRPSVVISAVILVGMLITVLGVVFLAMGLGGSTMLDLKIGDNEFETSSVAIVITAAGLLMTLLPIMKLPEGVGLFGAVGSLFGGNT